ncbi:MAG TPA: hypothetical protein QF571_02405, partial [Desulfobacterales bacterium]|nr:hypothetical protein [Desulfobacterales bacterium]
MITIDKLDKYISNHIEGRKPPVEYLQKYRARVGADFFKLRISNDDARKVIQNALVFVVDRPNYYFLRVSISFKKRGFKTILLTRWGTEEYQKMFFDHIVLYDKFSDLKLLKNCVNCKFYVQSWIGWNFLPVYVSLITNQNIVCNIHDLSNVLFDDNEKLMMLPGWSKRDIDIDLKCEDYILRKFPLVTSMYNSNAFKTFDSDIQKRFGKNILFFPCHPSPHFFDLETRKFSEPLNLVYMGGIPSDDKPDAVFFGGKMRNVLDDLLAQPFRVTIFNNPQLTTTDNQNEINIKYQHLTKSSYESSRFTFEKGYPPWELKSYAKE